MASWKLSQGICKEVSVWVQGIKIRQPFFLLELGGTDVVLKVDWSATLGKIKANFPKLVFRWNKDGVPM